MSVLRQTFRFTGMQSPKTSTINDIIWYHLTIPNLLELQYTDASFKNKYYKWYNMVSFDNVKSVNCSIRKDIDVNEHERLSHFTLRHSLKVKQQLLLLTFYTVVHVNRLMHVCHLYYREPDNENLPQNSGEVELPPSYSSLLQETGQKQYYSDTNSYRLDHVTF